MNPHIHKIRLPLHYLIKPTKIHLCQRAVHLGRIREVCRNDGAEPPREASARRIQRVPGAQVEAEVHERAVSDTPAACCARDGKAVVGRGDGGPVAAEARGRVPQRRGEEVGGVQCPVPVWLCAGVAAFLAEGLFVGGDVVAVPG